MRASDLAVCASQIYLCFNFSLRVWPDIQDGPAVWNVGSGGPANRNPLPPKKKTPMSESRSEDDEIESVFQRMWKHIPECVARVNAEASLVEKSNASKQLRKNAKSMQSKFLEAVKKSKKASKICLASDIRRGPEVTEARDSVERARINVVEADHLAEEADNAVRSAAAAFECCKKLSTEAVKKYIESRNQAIAHAAGPARGTRACLRSSADALPAQRLQVVMCVKFESTVNQVMIRLSVLQTRTSPIAPTSQAPAVPTDSASASNPSQHPLEL